MLEKRHAKAKAMKQKVREWLSPNKGKMNDMKGLDTQAC